MNEWIGIGPSASSQYQNKRWKNPSNLEEWIIGVDDGFSKSDYEEFKRLSNADLAEDAVLFGLRMNQGINLNTIGNRFQISSKYFDDLSHFFEMLSNEGLANYSDGMISLTSEGRIRADAIAAEIPVQKEPEI
jgi:oxygen-independent coproporphyrinogen-3 oxidase